MAGSPGARGANRKAAPLSLKGRALALLAQREHSAAELRRKLLRHVRARRDPNEAPEGLHAPEVSEALVADAPEADAADAAEVDAVIDWLAAHGHLSEARFIDSRVHARSDHYGNLRIRQELAQHGLALPPEAAQALRDSELARATAVWQRKFGDPAPDAAGRARQARFLAQRGFSPEVVARVLRGAVRADGHRHADPDADPDANLDAHGTAPLDEN